MTADEEALLRAVVDAPGDDAPRLVYADWLEEHGHPERAEYLRFEVKLAHHLRGAALDREAIIRWLANEFNQSQIVLNVCPCWLARVSRPPMGVCCEHITFADPSPDRIRPAVSVEGIWAIDDRLFLPKDYQAFLLNYNGGRPRPATFRLPDGGSVRIDGFHSLWSMDGTAVFDEGDLVRSWQRHLGPLGQGFGTEWLEIGRADGGRRLYLNLDTSYGSRVLLGDPNDTRLSGWLADTHFAEVLARFEGPAGFDPDEFGPG